MWRCCTIHGILESGGGNDYPQHRGSSTAHTRDTKISRAITAEEVLAATESTLVAFSSHYRDNSLPEEAAISESEENDSDYRKVADKSRAYKHISLFLHQACMQTILICTTDIFARLLCT